jgi:hypothetical protein
MKSESQSNQMQYLASNPREMCIHKNPLRQVAENIDWTEVEAELSPLYAKWASIYLCTLLFRLSLGIQN